MSTLTSSATSNLPGYLTQAWTASQHEIEELLNGLKQKGCRFFLFNLPLYYEPEKLPTDIDIIIAPDDLAKAVEVLDSFGLVRLTHSPGTKQYLFVGKFSGGEFVRLHLHSDLCFSGISLARFDWLISITKTEGGQIVPTAELDLFLLYIQGFFKRKSNYPDRIAQVRYKIDQSKWNSLKKSLDRPVLNLLTQIVHDCNNGNRITVGSKLVNCLIHFPLYGSMYRALFERLAERLRPRIIGRRRGLVLFLMGIDGTGKSSLAREIVRSHDRGGMISKSAYLGLKVTLVQRVRSLIMKQNERERFDGQSGIADRLAPKSSLVANLFNLGISFAYIAEYFVRSIWLNRSVNQDNDLLIIDRSYYDKLTQPKRWGNRLFYYLLPKPDIVIALFGDSKHLYERKPEFEAEVLNRMQQEMEIAWSLLEKKQIPLLKLDSIQNDLATCTRLSNDLIWSIIKSKSKLISL